MSDFKVYTLPEITAEFGISDYALRKAIKSGDLKARLIGGAYRVTEDNLRAFIEGEN